MSEDQKKINANYPAMLILLLTFVPLVMIELNPASSNQELFKVILKQFGLLLFFQMVLMVLIGARTVVKYDDIKAPHNLILISLIGVTLFAWAALFMGYLGYFSGGANIFLWLNQ